MKIYSTTPNANYKANPAFKATPDQILAAVGQAGKKISEADASFLNGIAEQGANFAKYYGGTSLGIEIPLKGGHSNLLKQGKIISNKISLEGWVDSINKSKSKIVKLFEKIQAPKPESIEI